MKLSKHELKILSLAELRASEPLPRIAKQLRMPVSTARYCMDRLKERGVIMSCSIDINTMKLGLTNHAIYFSLAASDLSERDKILSQLSSDPRVAWLAEFKGTFQYALTIRTRHISELSQTLERFTNRFPRLFFRKALSIRLSTSIFGRSFEGIFLDPRPVLHSAVPISTVTSDALDEQILDSLSSRVFESNRELALRSDIPPATFDRRVKRLEEKGVINGYFYRLNIASLGRSSYRVFLSVKARNEATSKKVFDYCASSPFIRKCIECLGAWDYEIEVEHGPEREVGQIVSTVSHFFGDDLTNIEMLPLEKHLVYRPHTKTVNE